jgi:hypothetical protein
MKPQPSSSVAQNATTLSENTPEFTRFISFNFRHQHKHGWAGTSFGVCSAILESINSVFSIVLCGYEYKMKKDKPLTKKERDEKRKKHKEKQLATQIWQEGSGRKEVYLGFLGIHPFLIIPQIFLNIEVQKRSRKPIYCKTEKGAQGITTQRMRARALAD